MYVYVCVRACVFDDSLCSLLRRLWETHWSHESVALDSVATSSFTLFSYSELHHLLGELCLVASALFP